MLVYIWLNQSAPLSIMRGLIPGDKLVLAHTQHSGGDWNHTFDAASQVVARLNLDPPDIYGHQRSPSHGDVITVAEGTLEVSFEVGGGNGLRQLPRPVTSEGPWQPYPNKHINHGKQTKARSKAASSSH